MKKAGSDPGLFASQKPELNSRTTAFRRITERAASISRQIKWVKRIFLALDPRHQRFADLLQFRAERDG